MKSLARAGVSCCGCGVDRIVPRMSVRKVLAREPAFRGDDLEYWVDAHMEALDCGDLSYRCPDCIEADRGPKLERSRQLPPLAN